MQGFIKRSGSTRAIEGVVTTTSSVICPNNPSRSNGKTLGKTEQLSVSEGMKDPHQLFPSLPLDSHCFIQDASRTYVRRAIPKSYNNGPRLVKRRRKKTHELDRFTRLKAGSVLMRIKNE